MALATLANLKPPLIQILNANRGSYSSSVGTGADRMGAYPFDQEVVDALLRADGHVITEGYFLSKMALRDRFFVPSSNLANGDQLPEFQGLIGKCEYSLDGVTWSPSVESQSKDDVVGARASGAAYVGANAFAGQHFIDDADGCVYHSSPFFRIEYPAYTRTTVLQANQGHDGAILAFAVAFLYKERSNAAFEYYKSLADDLLARIVNGAMKLPAAIVKPMSGGAG